MQDSCRQRVKNSSFAQPAEFRHVKSEMYPQRGDAMTSPPRWRQKRSGPVCQYSPSIKFRKVTGTSCCAENRQSRALLCHSVRPYVCVYGNMRLSFSRALPPLDDFRTRHNVQPSQTRSPQPHPIHTDRETGRAHSALGSFVRCSAGYSTVRVARSYRMHINVCVVERKAKPRAPAEAA